MCPPFDGLEYPLFFKQKVEKALKNRPLVEKPVKVPLFTSLVVLVVDQQTKKYGAVRLVSSKRVAQISGDQVDMEQLQYFARKGSQKITALQSVQVFQEFEKAEEFAIAFDGTGGTFRYDDVLFQSKQRELQHVESGVLEDDLDRLAKLFE